MIFLIHPIHSQPLESLPAPEFVLTLSKRYHKQPFHMRFTAVIAAMAWLATALPNAAPDDGSLLVSQRWISDL